MTQGTCTMKRSWCSWVCSVWGIGGCAGLYQWQALKRDKDNDLQLSSCSLGHWKMWGQNSALTAFLRDFSTSDIFSSQLDQATADVTETWGELCYKRELKWDLFIYKIYSHLEYCIQFLASQWRSGVDLLESLHSLDSIEHTAHMLKSALWVPTARFTSLNIKSCCSLRCHRLFHLTSRAKNQTKTWVGRTELYFQNVLTHSAVTNIFQGGQVFQGLVRSSFEKLKGQRFHYLSGTVLWCFITLILFDLFLFLDYLIWI